MQKSKMFFGIIFLCTLFILYGEEHNAVKEKITSLLKTHITEASEDELHSFYDSAMKKRVIKRLQEIGKNSEVTDALIDYITVDNYKITNVIKLDNGNIFLNYRVRSDDEKKPQNRHSEKVLGRLIYNHHVFFIYNPDKKHISHIQHTYTAYSLLLFHKYAYDGNLILYTIGNNSSFGMAKTDMYFIAFSADNLELLFSECVDFSQEYYSREIDDIAFQKDFIFDKNSIRFSGKVFDFNSQCYKAYDKTYALP